MFLLNVPKETVRSDQLALLYDLLYPTKPLTVPAKVAFITSILTSENYSLLFEKEANYKIGQKIMEMSAPSSGCGCNR